MSLQLVELADAPKRSADPTKTAGVRRAWRAAAQMRLRRLRAQIRTAIVDSDILGLGGGDATPIMAYHPKATRLDAFSNWLNASAIGAFAGPWSVPYIRSAWQLGAARAIGGPAPEQNSEDYEYLAAIAIRELKGITAAIVQQVSRDAELCLKQTRAKAWSKLSKRLDKVAINRLNGLCNTLTVKSFNDAQLATFRKLGYTHVGVLPELGKHKHKRIKRDAASVHAAGVIFVTPDDLALFVKRNDTGEWAIPAGGIENGEMPSQAASREAAEETGYPGDWRLHISIVTPRAVSTSGHLCSRCRSRSIRS